MAHLLAQLPDKVLHLDGDVVEGVPRATHAGELLVVWLEVAGGGWGEGRPGVGEGAGEGEGGVEGA